MQEFLRFYTASSDGSMSVLVRLNNGVLAVEIDSQIYPLYNGVRILPREEGETWRAALEAVHIDRWESYYGSDAPTDDGTRWAISFQTPRKPCLRVSGDGAYPDNWSAFLGVMDKIAPVVSPWPIDWLSLRYRWHESPPTQFEYGELLTIDRGEETIAHSQFTNAGVDILKRYRIEGGVSRLLDDCAPILSRFSARPGEPEGFPRYELEIVPRYGEGIVIRGIFDRPGLPEAWGQFAERLRGFLLNFGYIGDIMNPAAYGRGAKPGEYIYCSVAFDEYGKTYYYRTEDASLRIGDEVIVPVGGKNAEKRVRIANIKYFTDDGLPIPLDQVKSVLRKAEDDTGD